MKNGSYILYYNSDISPIVVEQEFIDILNNKNIESNILKEYDLLVSNKEDILIEEDKNNFKLLLLFLSIILSIIIIIINFKINNFICVPLSKKRIFFITLYMAIFSLITSLIHELGHIYFSKGNRRINCNIHFALKKSIVMVNMNHIWTWSMKSRVAALLAGIGCDLFILSFFVVMSNFYDNNIIKVSVYILIFRILWQLGFHRNCDGYLILQTILDNPNLNSDYHSKKFRNRKDIKILSLFRFFGYACDFLLILLIALFIFLIISCDWRVILSV